MIQNYTFNLWHSMLSKERRISSLIASRERRVLRDTFNGTYIIIFITVIKVLKILIILIFLI